MKPEFGLLLSLIAIVIGGILTLLGGAGQFYFGQMKDDQKDSLYSESQRKIQSQNQLIIESQSKVQAQVAQIDFLKHLIEAQQKDLKGYTAGIGGYLGFGFRYEYTPNYFGIDVHNPSKYPVVGAYGYWADLDDKTQVTIESLRSKQFPIGDVHPNRGTDGLLSFDLSKTERFRTNIFLVYNGGGGVCLLRIAKIGGKLSVAFKIETSPTNTENRVVIPDDFPKDFPGYSLENPEGIFN